MKPPLKPLATVWFSGVDPEKREAFESIVRNSTTALSKLYEILDQRYRSAERSLLIAEHDAGYTTNMIALISRMREIRALQDLISFAR